jgi:hypothetical protein
MNQPIKTFTVFRRGDLSETHDENQRPASPDEPAYWGVVFPDGTCVLRWAGAVVSHSVWASFEDAMKIHGHPEPRYGTELVWHSVGELNSEERDRLREKHRVGQNEADDQCQSCYSPDGYPCDVIKVLDATEPAFSDCDHETNNGWWEFVYCPRCGEKL